MTSDATALLWHYQI